MDKVLSGTIDDHILGKFNTDSPCSPYFNGQDLLDEEVYLCNSCLDDFPNEEDVLLASYIRTKKPVHICKACSTCLDDEAYINVQLKKRKMEALISTRIKEVTHEPVSELLDVLSNNYLTGDLENNSRFPGLSHLWQILIQFKSEPENNPDTPYVSTRESIRIMIERYVYSHLIKE